MMPQRWLSPGLLVLNGTLIAATYACAKVAGTYGISALGVLAWQVGFSAVVLTAIVAIRGELPRLTRANLRYAAGAGVLGITGPNLVTFAALAHLPSGLIGVITSLSAVFTCLIVLVLRAEPPNALRATGVVVGLVGVAGIVLPHGSLPSPEALPWVLVAVVAPLLLAGGNVFRSIAWPDELRPMSAAALLLVLQAVVLVPTAIAGGHFEIPSVELSGGDIALLMAGALTTAFFLGAFELQKRGGPVVVAQLGYVITIASLGIGILLFGDRHSPTTFAAVGAVLLGVALVNRRTAAPSINLAESSPPVNRVDARPSIVDDREPRPLLRERIHHCVLAVHEHEHEQVRHAVRHRGHVDVRLVRHAVSVLQDYPHSTQGNSRSRS